MRPYPHVVVRLMPTVYSLAGVHVPEGGDPEEAALERARWFVRERGFRACAVLSPTECIFVERNGTEHRSTRVPDGATHIVLPQRQPEAAPEPGPPPRERWSTAFGRSRIEGPV